MKMSFRSEDTLVQFIRFHAFQMQALDFGQPINMHPYSMQRHPQLDFEVAKGDICFQFISSQTIVSMIMFVEVQVLPCSYDFLLLNT